jgi:hypothetical protein
MTARGQLRAAIVALSVGGVALSLVSTSKYGVGLSADGATYLSTARNLAAGHGYRWFDGSPYTGWPPLFPTLVASIGLVGIDPVTGARFLNAFAFGGTILASGVFFTRCLRSKVLVLIATSSILLSYPLLGISSMALTEAVFVLLIALFVLEISSFVDQGCLRALLTASALAGLCGLQRYTGVTLILAGTILVAFFNREPRWLHRLKHVTCFLLISCVPMSFWVVRNIVLTGMATGSPRLHSVYSLKENAAYAADTATRWLMPALIPLSMRVGIVAGLAVVVAVILLVYTRDQQGDPCHSSHLWPAALTLLIYLSLMLYTHQVGVLNEPMNDRYMSPLAVLGPWLLFAGIDRLMTWLSVRCAETREVGRIVMGLCLIWLTYPLERTCQAVADRVQHGAGEYSTVGWQTSPLVRWLRTHPLEGKVWCNAPDALYALTGSSAVTSPHRTWDLSEFSRTVASGPGGRLVWFSCSPRTYAYDLEELAPVLGIEEMAAFPDGGVYRILSTPNTVFGDSRIFSTCIVDGIWNRSFTSDQFGPRGTITSWILRLDGVTESEWTLDIAGGPALTWRVSGRYTRSERAFASRCEGLASQDGNDVAFACCLDVSGTVEGDTATGVYRVEFVNPRWPAIAGSWRVDLARPVYRLYSAPKAMHLYTMSRQELRAHRDLLFDGWTDEGLAFYAYPPGEQPPDARPVYGLVSARDGARLLTIDEAERRWLVEQYPAVWRDGAIAFYAFSEDSHPHAAQPVYRFWLMASDAHFYTTSPTERDKLVQDYSHVWKYEGIVWYAFAPRQWPEP